MELFLGAFVLIFILYCIKQFAYNIFTLSFLPGAFHMFDGNMSSYTIPIIGKIIEPIINYVCVLVLNIVDFFVWFVHWIPGLGYVIDRIYKAPDEVEKTFKLVHRNFITHSIFNPRIVAILVIGFVLLFAINKISTKLSSLVATLICFTLLIFSCHLIADTMPQSWVGFALIKTPLFTLSGFLSKVWLYMNIIICLLIVSKTSKMIEE
ncbi:hypothetical protein DWC20_16170 [Clostridium botulinum]|uniref:hypothetical protein n=1 Tax=Clostridium botulinum TaxID=1491 RepID=UPI000376D3CA|nr:hypothetical protein [Clostridium botulinum]MBN1037072.1 hypothetical protein [Clostridium botulinum]